MVAKTVSTALRKVFGTRNDRLLKRYTRRVEQINDQESVVRQMTDEQIRERVVAIREAVKDGESLSDHIPEALAIAREAMDRAVGIRNTLDPELAQQHNFEVDKLPADMQQVYQDAQAKMAELEPLPVLGGEPAPAHLQVDLPPAYYEAVREMYSRSRPPFRARPFDVQLIGGMVLFEGKIAEMKTGEGKTIVAPLACFLAHLDDLRCHVVTTNDYLVQRDRDWVFPFYQLLGLTVGAIHPMHQQPPQLKAQAYQCNVLYGTNSELGFDYLRDNMKTSAQEQFQKSRDFVIVDEIDSILIDEARTPLIISGPAHNDAPRYELADKLARHLIGQQKEWTAADEKVQQCEVKVKTLEGDIRNARDKAKLPAMRNELKSLMVELPQLEEARDQYTQYYEIEMDRKAAHLTHEGVSEAQKLANIGSFYVGNNMDMPHLLENALRAHAVYKRDKDYVVQQGEVVIVDEFTGRLMVGRQWSDGLHQAVESKERVKVKEETQTLATVTIQNFFKLYKRLAGMTGTAITEQTEFHEIYGLEVVSIPTNVPIARVDRDDLIYLSTKDKWSAITDEIKRIHDLGRPILVGTTSVEKSEMLSEILRKRHGVKHQVLNAKAENAEREGNIVLDAGQLGSVTIATNMAGRGTDIKLGRLDREELIRHWQQRDMISKDADPAMSNDELVAMSYRHQAMRNLGFKKGDAQSMSDDDMKLELLRHWCVTDAFVSENKAKSMDMAQCAAVLDRLPDYYRHRLQVWDNVEAMGGLYILGTERHESRRIDNQLRGRAGRQGDNGCSRFFISMEDDLMKMFAGKATLTALSKLGMKEGDAIEHKWVTGSVQRAQRKVEERNYQIRKTLLEYDEVMEYQRNFFYGVRQRVLEGNDIEGLIFEYIGQSVDDAVNTYLDKFYLGQQIAEWCRSQLDISLDPSRVVTDDFEELEEAVRNSAYDEVTQVVDVTLGEYMSNDSLPEDWDLEGLAGWAKSRFDVDFKKRDLQSMSVDDVRAQLIEAANENVANKDLTGLNRFIDPLLGAKELANWARNKFTIELVPEELADPDRTPESVADSIVEQARESYSEREVTYPINFLMDMVLQGMQSDPGWAVQQILNFANQRFALGWTPESVDGKQAKELFDLLVEEQRAWLRGGKLEVEADRLIEESNNDFEKLRELVRDRFNMPITDEDQERVESDDPETAISLRDLVIDKGRKAFRGELSQLERFVLIQILDQAWKDHLYAMDQLRDSVNLRSYAEKDPRIEYKREGANHFAKMQQTVRERVTELIFRARLTPNVQQRSAYGAEQQAQHPAAASQAPAQAGASVAAAQAAAAQGTAQQQADMEAAQQAGDRPRPRPMSRSQRRRAQDSSQSKPETTQPIHKQRKKRSR